jgi:hypothetical protein
MVTRHSLGLSTSGPLGARRQRAGLQLEPLEDRTLFSAASPLPAFDVSSVPLPTASQPQAAIVGDFTGTGVLDIATLDAGPDNVSILLGNGDGSFRPGSTLTIGDTGAKGLVEGDFNRDGKLDLGVLTTKIIVFLGNGNGTFLPALHPIFDSATAQAIATADFNHDGKIDLAIANDNATTVSILLGKGNGAFKTPRTFSLGNTSTAKSFPVAVIAADLNGDGIPDLATANRGSNTLAVALGNGDGTFKAPLLMPAGGLNPMALAAGDFNGDGNVDLVTANADSNSISVYLGNGNGTFQPALTPVAVGLDPLALVAADFNNDSHLDLAVADHGTNDVTILFGAGDGTFPQRQTYAVGAAPKALLLGDFNRDGKTDLASADSHGNDISVLLQRSAVTTSTQSQTTTGPENLRPTSIAVGDFNNDGKVDVVTANLNSEDLALLAGRGDGTFLDPIPIHGLTETPQNLVTGDFNGDGKLDLAVAQGDGTVSLLLGNGNGTFAVGPTVAVGAVPSGLAAADLNNDGKLDLVTANVGAGTITVLLGNGDGTFEALRQITLNTASGLAGGPNDIVAGDFNGDGILDLATTMGLNNTVSLLLGNGNGTFQSPEHLAVDGLMPSALILGDFNRDQHLDLMTANFGSSNVSLLLGNGDGTFLLPRLFKVRVNPRLLVAGDYNGDDLLDVAVTGGKDDNVSLLLGLGDGTFAPQSILPLRGNPLAIGSADFNNDGIADLAVGNLFADSVSVVLLNNSDVQSVDGVPLPREVIRTFSLVTSLASIVQPTALPYAAGTGTTTAELTAAALQSTFTIYAPGSLVLEALGALGSGSVEHEVNPAAPRGGSEDADAPAFVVSSDAFVPSDLASPAPGALPPSPASNLPVGIKVQVVFRPRIAESAPPVATLVPSMEDGAQDKPATMREAVGTPMFGLKTLPPLVLPALPKPVQGSRVAPLLNKPIPLLLDNSSTSGAGTASRSLGTHSLLCSFRWDEEIEYAIQFLAALAAGLGQQAPQSAGERLQLNQ